MVIAHKEVLDAAREWIGTVDASRADVKQHFDEFGFSASIRPRNSSGCSVALEIDRFERVSFTCGRTIRVSDWAVE
jgi:hypothetical protein